MNEQDDQDWLDALAGRSGRASSTGGVEGRRLRAAMATLPKPDFIAADEGDASRESALLERARQAGLIGTSQPGAESATPFDGRRARRVLGGLAIAAAVCLAVLFGLSLREPGVPPTEVFRGTGVPLRLEVENPAAMQDRLLEALRSTGVEADGYSWLDRHGVDAELSTPVRPEVMKVLEAFGIQLPEDGLLRVEFVQAGE